MCAQSVIADIFTHQRDHRRRNDAYDRNVWKEGVAYERIDSGAQAEDDLQVAQSCQTAWFRTVYDCNLYVIVRYLALKNNVNTWTSAEFDAMYPVVGQVKVRR